MAATKQKKIVFVCTGNTCRSPMAEYLLKQALKIRGFRDIKVCSVGTAAKKGDSINPKSAQVLLEHGIEVGEFSSTPLTDRLLRDAFAFVCMTERHAELLMDMRWNALRKSGAEDIENNVYSFGEITGYDIMDPYGRDLECYRYVYGLLEAGMSALIEKLELEKHARIVKPRASSVGAKRGRPKKEPSETPTTPKRGRGRPKKTLETEQIHIDF